MSSLVLQPLSRAAFALTLSLAAGSAAAVDPSGLGGFDCLVEPQLVVDLSTREEGIIDAILVRRGDDVSRGQAIVRLDADIERATVQLAEARTQMQAEIDERQADVAFARRELERIEDLLARRAVSSRDRDQARTEHARSEMRLRQVEQTQRLTTLELERARRLLERRTLRSPIDGIVVEVLMAPGESVEGQAIVRLAQVDPLRVEVIVPVVHLGAIRPGAPATVRPHFPGAQPRAATVTIVDRIVDAASDTFGVQLELANADYRIPGGVRCDIEIEP